MLRQRQFRALCLVTVTVPLLAVCLAAYLAWGRAVGVADVVACAVMFLLTMIGIEVGYHRHFAHRTFRAKEPVRVALAALGAMAFQGSVLWWSGIHRTHHRFSDKPGDPHSPLEGLWMAHAGWLFQNINPDRWTRRIKDLLKDPTARAAHRLYFLYVAMGLVAPAAAVGLATGSWQGVLTGFLWGGLVRIFLVNHVVWSINSICHWSGSTAYRTRDDSRNNYWLLLPSLGFSLHNNHHAFPGSATNAHHWWQLDLSACVIRGLEICGLAWDVRSPSIEQKRKKALDEACDAGVLVPHQELM